MCVAGRERLRERHTHAEREKRGREGGRGGEQQTSDSCMLSREGVKNSKGLAAFLPMHAYITVTMNKTYLHKLRLLRTYVHTFKYAFFLHTIY